MNAQDVFTELRGQQDGISPQPAYRLTVGSKDVTPAIDTRLISLTLTDNRGFDADQLDLELDDTDGLLAIPPRGSKLTLALGWTHTGLVDKGTYTVDEIEHVGTPDRLVIRARSADLRAGLTFKRDASFHGVTLADIVNGIAQRNNLKAMLSAALVGQVIDHIDQTSESDANLLTRLARMFDAIATVKGSRLLFMRAGEAVTASGKPLPPVVITRSSGDQHRFSVADRETYTGVKAYYQDTRRAKRGEVLITKENEEQPAPSAGKAKQAPAPVITQSIESVKVLRHIYATKSNAERAARAEWQRLQRGVATFSLTLARGNPELFPELPATLQGWKPQIDGTAWIIRQVVHELHHSGYTTRVEMEIKATEIPDEAAT